MTGGALAADRATAVVPVLVAETIFIAVFLFDLVRLRGGGEARISGVTFVNIELHSIAFSALFFWLIPTVAMAAVIGASQTEKAIPRILERFRRDLEHTNRTLTENTSELPELTEKNCDSKTRWLHGMYLWQPLRQEGISTVWENRQSELDLLRHYTGVWLSVRKGLVFIWGPIHLALPYLIVGVAVMTGVLISWRVPPAGWRCRTLGEMVFLLRLGRQPRRIEANILDAGRKVVVSPKSTILHHVHQRPCCLCPGYFVDLPDPTRVLQPSRLLHWRRYRAHPPRTA